MMLQSGNGGLITAKADDVPTVESSESKTLLYKGFPEIVVNSGPGYYILPSDDASGKTYLYNSLLRRYPAGVMLGTYRGYFTLDLECEEPSLVIFDRVDMYDKDQKFISVLRGLPRSAIVLFDYKSLAELFDIPFDAALFIEVSSKRIEVYA